MALSTSDRSKVELPIHSHLVDEVKGAGQENNDRR
jgi:hypothetical protein